MFCDVNDCPHRHLFEPILQELRAAPAGLSEYELLRRLSPRADAEGLSTEQLRDAMGLFRVHFTLFHCLYHLREMLLPEGRDLTINCLRIAMGAVSDAGGQALSAHDPLADYYLDLGNLETMDAAQVEALLGDFWRLFQRNSRRDEALGVLGLEGPASDAEIKAQYRRLAMQHHPDRGGDPHTLQRINEAMTVLGKG
ncbi:DnaJ domain-containing protein [Ectothiorhodospiraceae bacterium WFHF3C12]|nr:DnaJ domain-containing protein [Ectothiorhodospiraceae bacterium WFHF3C12]